MAAYDNVSLPGAPNIATAGNFAQQLFSMLSQLPQDYYKGQQSQYQQRQNNLFQGGVPTNDSGNIDFAATLRQMLQSGGAPVAGQVLPLLQKQPFLDAALTEYQSESGGGTNAGPATSTAASGPANITGATQSQVNANPGADTVRTLSAGIGGSDRDIPGAVMDRIARSLGLTDANAGIPEGQLEAAKTRIGDFLNRTASSGTSPTVTRPNPAPQSGAGGDENNTNQGTPVGVGGSSAISPAPTSASGNIAGAPGQRPTTPSDRINAAYSSGAPGGAAGMVPPGYDPLTYAQALKRRAEALRRQANTQGIIGIPTKAKEDQASALDKQADAILEQLGKAGELTKEEKNRRSGTTQFEAQTKDDTTRYGKLISSIQGSAQAANRQLEHIQLAEGLYKNPDFYSGAGEGLNLMYKRVVNALNPNNTEPLPQEAFRKTMAAAVLNQVEQLKDDTAAVGGGGRIFQAQIELMEKAANNPDNTVPANRLLTEIAKRGALEAKHVAQMANSYKGGHLDAGFAQQLDDYYTKHPMFTKAEMDDIRLIAPPVAPRLDSQEQATAWARKAGLKPGDPVKLPSGRIIPAP